jgi:outer membrane protein assembly factor BamB
MAAEQPDLMSGDTGAIDYAMYRGDMQHTGVYSPGEVPQDITLLWTTPVKDPSGDPVICNGVVYIGNRSGSLSAFKATDGHQVWATRIPCNGGGQAGATLSTPLVYNNLIYYNWIAPGGMERLTILKTSDGTSADGSCGGAAIGDRNDIALSSPVPAGEDVVFEGGSDSGIWYSAPNTVSADPFFQAKGSIYTSPARDSRNNKVFFGDDAGNVYAINGKSYPDNPVWTFKTGGAVRSSPAISQGGVYIGSNDGYLYALGEADGKLIWKKNLGGAVWSSPAVDSRYVYVLSGTGTLSAITKPAGFEVWSKIFTVETSVSPTIADNRLYLGTSAGELLALDVNTGDKRAGYPNYAHGQPDPVTSSAMIANGTVYYTTKSGSLVALGGATPAPASNVLVFGDLNYVFTWPTGFDYHGVGGASAIRRDGSLTMFVPGPKLPKDPAWVAVTNGAAITDTGDLAVWVPRGSNLRWNPCGNYRTVAVSQWRSWLLTIYIDEENQTRLLPIANMEAPEAVFKNIPPGTGWIKVAAGATHALALTTDGHLVAWGDNTDGQLNLPTDITYRDIDAGDAFSLALSTDGTIYAAGNNAYNQVSGKPSGNGYIQVEAGAGTAAALDKDGRIIVWGKPVRGTAPPSDPGYTDIALGSDVSFAIREMAGEVRVTAPLSPGATIKAGTGTDVTIPFGSAFEHTHNDVLRVFAPNGTPLLWANDAKSQKIRFPSGVSLPLSVFHYIPSGSRIDAKTDYHATVDLGGESNGAVMTVSEDAWYDEKNPTVPRALCFADTGCSVGTTAKQQVFLSTPLAQSTPGGSPADGDIPVLSVHQLTDTAWLGTLSTLGSANPAESRSVIIDKNNINPDQFVNFTLFGSNWGSDPSQAVTMSTKSSLTSENAVLKYSGIGVATRQVPTMTLTPRIWRQEP